MDGRLFIIGFFMTNLLTACGSSVLELENGTQNPTIHPRKTSTAEQIKIKTSIVESAQKWIGKYFNKGLETQCANFVRKVLSESCSTRFALDAQDVLQATRPWDATAVISKHGADFGPSYADSLAGSEIGERVSYGDLEPGDLIFLERTYGSYGHGVITHVGIYVGKGQYIDRSGATEPIRQRTFDSSLFYGALRIHPTLCK